MKQYILFNKVKITNSPVQSPNHVSDDLHHWPCSSVQSLRSQIILSSMHRYMPRLHIVQASDSYSIRTGPLSTFVFEETAFIAVTAYQNDQVSSDEEKPSDRMSSIFRSRNWKSIIIRLPKAFERPIMGKSTTLTLSERHQHFSLLAEIIPSPWKDYTPLSHRINSLDKMNRLHVPTEVIRLCSLLVRIPLRSTRTFPEWSLIPPPRPISIIVSRITNTTVIRSSVRLDSIRWLCLHLIPITSHPIHSTVVIPVIHRRWCTIQRTPTWARHTNRFHRSLPTVDIHPLSIITIPRLSELVFVLFCFVLCIFIDPPEREREVQ